MTHLLAGTLLVLVYALTLASFKPLDLVAGALVAAAVLRFGRGLLHVPQVPGRVLLARMARFPLFAGAVVREIVIGTWRMALVVIGVRPLRRPGIVAVPIGERSEAGVAATALAITLSPGEALVDVDWDRRVMLFHVIDASDPGRLREHYDRFYRRYQRGVFP